MKPHLKCLVLLLCSAHMACGKVLNIVEEPPPPSVLSLRVIAPAAQSIVPSTFDLTVAATSSESPFSHLEVTLDAVELAVVSAPRPAPCA